MKDESGANKMKIGLTKCNFESEVKFIQENHVISIFGDPEEPR